MNFCLADEAPQRATRHTEEGTLIEHQTKLRPRDIHRFVLPTLVVGHTSAHANVRSAQQILSRYTGEVYYESGGAHSNDSNRCCVSFQIHISILRGIIQE